MQFLFFFVVCFVFSIPTSDCRCYSHRFVLFLLIIVYVLVHMVSWMFLVCMVQFSVLLCVDWGVLGRRCVCVVCVAFRLSVCVPRPACRSRPLAARRLVSGLAS